MPDHQRSGISEENHHEERKGKNIRLPRGITTNSIAYQVCCHRRARGPGCDEPVLYSGLSGRAPGMKRSACRTKLLQAVSRSAGAGSLPAAGTHGFCRHSATWPSM